MESPLDVAAALKRLGGDRGILRDIGQFFLEDAPQFLSLLREALRHRDASEVERAAHCLKGLAANFDALELKNIAQVVERCGRAADIDGAAQLAPQLEQELHRVLVAVKSEVIGE